MEVNSQEWVDNLLAKQREDAELMADFPEYQLLKDIPEPPEVDVWSTGIPGLDKHLRIPSIGLMNVCGPAGGGKSSILRRILFNIAKNCKKTIALTCMEENVKYDTLDVFRRMWSEKEVHQMTSEETLIADSFVHNQFHFIRRQGAGLFTGDRLLEGMCLAFERNNAPDIFCVDPFNEVDHRPGKEFGSKTDYIGDLIIQIKATALHYQKLVIIAAHPPIERVRFKKHDEVWGLADVADSAHFSNKADIGLGVWKIGTESYLNIDKIKNRRRSGTLSHAYPFTVSMRFDPITDNYRINKEGWKEINGKH